VSEHYTKNTLTATAYCRRCKRDTRHRIDSGRRGPCLDCELHQRLHQHAEKRRAGQTTPLRQTLGKANP